MREKVYYVNSCTDSFQSYITDFQIQYYSKISFYCNRSFHRSYVEINEENIILIGVILQV